MTKNVLEHELVPKHEILTKTDAKKLLESLGSTLEQLPGITENDPTVKGLNAKPGDVLKITRKSPTAGTAIYYRAVA
ncbi:MAG: DNA-directed RNA polymerase subunit H [DPANN group archaeon]|nr:DNA-directed RNA polymerase subunit H [DPANN group archaeon]